MRDAGEIAEQGNGLMADELPVPLRLRDLSEETILWLDRLDHKQREALIWCGHLEPTERNRLDDFLKLDPEKYVAGFKLLELWTRLSWLFGRLGWLGRTSVWIIMTTAGILIALTQIAEHLSRAKP